MRVGSCFIDKQQKIIKKVFHDNVLIYDFSIVKIQDFPL
jgi:hypothetical protein